MQSNTRSTDWLKADNWQAVLDDPSRLPAPILAHLVRENARAEDWLGGPEARQWIVDELRATIRDEDSAPPVTSGPYRYWQRFVEGHEYPDFCRQQTDSDTAEILLDGDARAAGSDYYDIGAADHSPDHQWFAVTEDREGAERYQLSLFQAGGVTGMGAPLTDCRGDFEWSQDSQALLYTRLDAQQRPASVWLHRLGTAQQDDLCVFVNPDPGRFLGLGKTSDEAFLMIDCHDHQTNQCFLLPADLHSLTPIAVTPWIAGLEYEVESVGDQLLIRTNHDHPDFALCLGPMPTPDAPSDPSRWRTLWAPPAGELFSDFEVLANHWILEVAREGLAYYLIAEAQTDALVIRDTLDLGSELHDTHLDPLPGYDRDRIRLRRSTPAIPPEVLEIDLNTGQSTCLKRSDPPNGHTPEHYVVRRHYGISSDGTRIPLTLVHHRDVTPGPETPVVLTGYGAYGMTLTPGFSASRRLLLTRGVLHVTAHVRGGMELGARWYLEGRGEAKDNSFNDLIGAAETLIRDRFTRAGRIVLHGGSAGGLLVGTAVMRRPELFAGVIADVPFVDVLETMKDDSLPLTPPEWPEWGNPLTSADAARRIGHYTPTEQVDVGPYPTIFATAGLTDPRVTYWEPARWIEALNQGATGGPFLLFTELAAGHGGPSGRYAGLDDLARIYQAMIRLLKLPEEPVHAL